MEVELDLQSLGDRIEANPGDVPGSVMPREAAKGRLSPFSNDTRHPQTTRSAHTLRPITHYA
jgi:hypothetical protein